MRIQTARVLLPRDQRRQSILRAAAAAFARTGFAGTSMDDVAAEAGITRLIVYRHFGSKEDLYRAVLEQVSTRLVEEFVAGLEAGRQGLGYRTLLTVAREDADGFVLLWRHAYREPQFAAYAREFRRAAVDVATTPLAGAFGTSAALARWAPEAVVDVMVSAVLAWLEHGETSADEEFLSAATAGLLAMVDAWR